MSNSTSSTEGVSQAQNTHTPGPWEIVDWLTRSYSRVYAVRRSNGGVLEYMGDGKRRRRFRTAESARDAIIKATRR